MINSNKATAEALNLQAVKNFLTIETSAEYVADDLDEIIFCLISLMGCDEDLFSRSNISQLVYVLKRLRDLFIRTALDNNLELKLKEIKEDYYFNGGFTE